MDDSSPTELQPRIFVWVDGEVHTTHVWTFVPSLLKVASASAYVYDTTDKLRPFGFIEYREGREHGGWDCVNPEDFPAEYKAFLLVNGYPTYG